MRHTKLTDADFIYKGYNKFHLWTYLFYHNLVNPQLQHLTIRERKQVAVKDYLKLLGFKNE